MVRTNCTVNRRVSLTHLPIKVTWQPYNTTANFPNRFKIKTCHVLYRACIIVKYQYSLYIKMCTLLWIHVNLHFFFLAYSISYYISCLLTHNTFKVFVLTVTEDSSYIKTHKCLEDIEHIYHITNSIDAENAVVYSVTSSDDTPAIFL